MNSFRWNKLSTGNIIELSFSTNVTPQSPFSPDLAVCNFWLFALALMSSQGQVSVEDDAGKWSISRIGNKFIVP